jgi:hypothetical protein
MTGLWLNRHAPQRFHRIVGNLPLLKTHGNNKVKLTQRCSWVTR